MNQYSISNRECFLEFDKDVGFIIVHTDIL